MDSESLLRSSVESIPGRWSLVTLIYSSPLHLISLSSIPFRFPTKI
jgi:hypothetical protein